MDQSASAGTVLFISRQRLVGATNGSSAYLLDLAGSVREAGFVPHLLQPTPRVTGRWPVLRMREEMGVFASHRIRGLVRIGSLFISTAPQVWLAAGWGILARLARRAGLSGRLFADRPFGYVVAEPWREADLQWLKQAAPADAKIAIADYMFCAEAFDRLPGLEKTAIVMHDLFHSRAGAEGDTVAAVDQDSEIRMLGRAQAVIAIQAAEAAFVAAALPASTVLLAPMAAAMAPAPAPGRDDRLLFVGSGTGPNVEGLRWFLDRVWPLVRAARPAARLDVAGTVGWAFPAGGGEGVRFLGMVADLEPLYGEAGVVVSPLTFGSGLKIKLVEAMARGKAVVATPVTLQGVEEIAEGAVVCTDEPTQLAAAIVEMAGNAEARAVLAGRALDAARRHFGRETCHAQLLDWLRR